MNPAKIHNLTRTAVKIYISFEDTLIATGTAMFYKHEDKRYLVTAAHNILGKHPETGKNLSKEAAIPDNLQIDVAVTEQQSEKVSAVRWKRKTVHLYKDKDRLRPIWFCHPTGSSIDIAVIPVDFDSSWHHAVNEDLSDYHNFRLYAGQDAFVLGFPEKFTGGGSTPIWKRATIANEPGIVAQKKGIVLIDTATRHGMSGSPVFAKESGIIIGEDIEHELKAHKMHPDTLIGSAYRFLGVYTSRPLSDSSATLAQLGSVFPKEIIDETLDAKKNGKSPF